MHVSEPEGERDLLDIRPLTDDEFAARGRLLQTIVPYAGPAWFVLHRSVVEHLVGFLNAPESEEFRAAMDASFMPEQSMIHTILANGMILEVEKINWRNLHRKNGWPLLYTDGDIETALCFDGSYFLHQVDVKQAPLLRTRLAERMRGPRDDVPAH